MKTGFKLLESDCGIILEHLREQYEANCELCGDNSEEAAEAKALYKKVFSNPLETCEKDIMGYYTDMDYAVGEDPEKYYSGDPSLIDMIRKIRLIKEGGEKGESASVPDRRIV